MGGNLPMIGETPHPVSGGRPLRTPAPALDFAALLETAREMGALPTTVTQLATLVADDDYAIGDVVDVVSLDQSLVADLLRQANSASSAPVVPVRTVREAAMRLGVGALLSLALSATVSDRMSGALPAYGLAEGALWRESVAASVAAEVVRVKSTVQVPAEAGTAALLHDLGKVVLSAHFGPEVLDMLAQAAATQRMPLLDIEKAVLGTDHAQIGGLIAGQWQLPTTIVEAISLHHERKETLTPICAAVSVAHAMVPELLADELVTDLTTGARATHGGLMRRLGLDTDAYPELLVIARGRYADLAGRYDAA
jgi:HD-like signal output (HDOD) protein